MQKIGGLDRLLIAQLLGAYGLELRLVADGESIPGSYWGDSEAGLRGSLLYARFDTPLHSVLHEAAHFICMTPERRAGLDTDAGGDVLEECGVCYVQILLAEILPQAGRERAIADMDAWGYSFREGNTSAWLAGDAADARAWLMEHGVLTDEGELSGELRV
jgi:hypothetical protein